MPKYKLKTLVVHNGNSYHKGLYSENYLPDAIKFNPSLVERVGGSDAEVVTTSKLKTEKVNVGVEDDIQKESFKGETPVVITDSGQQSKKGSTKTPETEKPEPKSGINVNTATVDQLSSIDGITVATAQMVVSEREKSKFSDLNDLDKRVALKGGRKWEGISDRFEFK